MHDKTVQRRRVGLALVVVVVLVSFGALFGGPVADVRRGADEVLSPIGDGASRAAKPIANLFRWVGDTVSAKGSLDDARKQRDDARDLAIRNQTAASENRQLRGLSELDQQPFSLKPYAPVTARVVVRSPSSWYERVVINKGTSSGIRAGMPVIAADDQGSGHGGLIGKTSSATATSAVVTLLANPSMAVGAKIVSGDVAGLVTPNISRIRDTILTDVPAGDDVAPGSLVVTQGTLSRRAHLISIYPPDLPIGRVTRVDDAGTPEATPHVRLFVDTRRIRYVQVLTKQVNGNR
ncbi:MAG: rod shape-determining protein MreC [Conexibacter sp.]|nr:rod shape-determining protein MreC [Conexibacter sp.]